MRTFIRYGLLALGLAATVGIVDGCSSSDTATIGAKGDAGTGAGGDGAIASGGGSGTGGGATGSGGSTGGSAGTGGTAGSTGGAGGGDAGPVTACTTDAQCKSLGERCDPAAGHCVHCLFDNECASTARCTNGSCVTIPSCTSSKDCRTPGSTRTICNTTTSLCVQCAADADCGANQICSVDTCVDSGTCTPPADGGTDAGAACKAGELCSAAGKCVQCIANSDCTGGQKCFTGTCRTPCASDNACTTGNQVCDLTMGACVDCTKDAECTALQYCSSGTCKADICAQGVKSCVGSFVIECTANGSGYAAPVECKAPESCVMSGTSASCQVPKLADGGAPPPTTCSDKQKNGDETDVDCGGSCPPCADGKVCGVPADCKSDVCQQSCALICLPGTHKTCRPSSCNDGVKNGTETDVDCGGTDCQRCPVNDACKQNSDCETDVCASGKCQVAQCTAAQCPSCFLPTDAACCKSNGLCGCAATFPLKGTCQ